jgi:hypothetical protein
MVANYGFQKDSCQLTSGELQGIPVNDDEMEDLCLNGTKCLVGRLGIAKKINKDNVKSVLTRIWRMEGSIFFNEIQPNLWLLEFTEDADKQRALAGKPWFYDRMILVLKDFVGKTPPSQMDFSSSPFWIQIHDMPLGCMNRRIGEKIGESLGSVEEIAVAANDVGGTKPIQPFRPRKGSDPYREIMLGGLQI